MNNTSLVPVKPDPFIENWRTVLGTAPNHLKFVRILGGVGTVTNGSVLLRSAVPVEDGFYKLLGAGNCRMLPVKDPQEAILGTSSDMYGWNASEPKFFPDIEQFNPHLEELPAISYIIKDDVIAMMHLCQDIASDAHDLERKMICIGDRYMTSFSKPMHSELTLSYNFSVPDGEELVLNAQELRMALTEGVRYDSIAVRLKRTRVSSVLILGDCWKACSMVTCAQRRR